MEGSEEALLTMAAYIDLNPVRAGMVSDPKDYRWCGYAEAVAGRRVARRGLAIILEQTSYGVNRRITWANTATKYRLLLFGHGEEREGDPEYGEYLAGECVTCHQPSGHADGIPSIVGLPKDYFVRALFEYKTNVRSNEVMKLRVANLANEEIAALAAYFSGLEPQ